MLALQWIRAGLLAVMLHAAPTQAGQVVGGDALHTVRPGEYLILIAARHGLPDALLARDNGLKASRRIHPGRVLRIDNRHIVPEGFADGIVINVPQRMLFQFRGGVLLGAYPVGLGRPDWPTPLGVFRVRHKAVDKEWVVPESIQEEMRREGKPVLTRVPPGPDNPLGRYWIGLAPGLWGIHGTIAPASIYHFQSHGCIRLHPDDVADLYPRVVRDEAVFLVYRPVQVTRTDDGAIYLEVHRNIYNQGHDPWQAIMDRAMELDAVEEIDWQRVDEVVNAAEGIARRVGREPLSPETIH